MHRLILTSAFLAWSVPAWCQPKIAFPNSPWDFGEVLQDESVAHQFEIRNEGTDTLFISRVKPSCGCTSAPLSRDVIAPGESVWIDVTFNSKKFSGEVNKSVVVYSNDPANPQSTFSFTADVATRRALVAPIGEPVQLGELLPGQANQARIVLANIGREPYRLRLAAWPSSWMQAEWTEKVVDPGDTLALAVGTLGVPPLGKFETSITFDVEGREKSRISLPVQGIGLVE